MKISLLTFISVVFLNLNLNAQENYIELTKTKSGKTKVIQELKRVKIKTNDGQKFIGNLVLVDEETLRIDKTEIPISEVAKIKRKSKAATVASSVFYVVGGLLFVTTTVVVIGSGGLAAALAAIFGYPASALFVGLAALTNDYPINNVNSKWNYRIVLSE